MKKTFRTLGCVIALTAGITPVNVCAAPDSIVQQIYNQYTKERPMTERAIYEERQIGEPWIWEQTEYQCYGFVISCTDIEALKNTTLNGHDVFWTESNLAFGLAEGWEKGNFLLQPIEGFIQACGEDDGYLVWGPVSPTASDYYSAAEEQLYLMNPCGRANVEDCAAALADSDIVTLHGMAVANKLYKYAYVGADSLADNNIRIGVRYTDGTTATELISPETYDTCRKALDYCENLMATDETIEFAWPDYSRQDLGIDGLYVDFEPLNLATYSATDIYTQQAAMQQDEFNATYIPIRPTETDFNYVNYFDWTQSGGLAIYCEDTAFLAEQYAIDCIAFDERLAYYQNFGADGESYVISDITLPEAYQGKQENVYFIAIPEEDTLTKLIADARAEIIGIEQLTQRAKAWPNMDATTIVIETEEGATVDAAMLSGLGAGAATYDAERNYWTFADKLSEDALFAFCAELEAMDEIAFAWPYGVFAPSAEYYTVTACDIVEIADYITFGDINCDDKVDSADAILVLREYAMSLTGESLLSTAEKAAADVNGDGDVDASDAILMLRYYSKSLGDETPDWQELLHPTVPAE